MTKAYLNRTLNTIFVATTLCALVTTIYKFFEVEGIEIFEHFFNINCISIALILDLEFRLQNALHMSDQNLQNDGIIEMQRQLVNTITFQKIFLIYEYNENVLNLYQLRLLRTS